MKRQLFHLKKIVSVFLVFLVFVVTVVSLNSSALQEGILYKVYDAQTGALLRSYYLNNDDNNSASVQGVIGTEERYTDWTKSGVVKIIGEPFIGNYYFEATGFVVDRHTIATAAHCVMSAGSLERNKITNILLFKNTDSTSLHVTPSMTATAVEYHVPIAYMLNNNGFDANGEAKYTGIADYALITVEEDLKDYVCFDLSIPLDKSQNEDNNIWNNSQNQNSKIKITGFPGKIGKGTDLSDVNDEGNHAKFTGEGKITDIDSERIYTDIDASSGNSGSPIYMEETVNGQTYNTVIGLYTTTHFETDPNIDSFASSGIRFTADVLQFYCGNINKQY